MIYFISFRVKMRQLFTDEALTYVIYYLIIKSDLYCFFLPYSL